MGLSQAIAARPTEELVWALESERDAYSEEAQAIMAEELERRGLTSQAKASVVQKVEDQKAVAHRRATSPLPTDMWILMANPFTGGAFGVVAFYYHRKGYARRVRTVLWIGAVNHLIWGTLALAFF